MIPLDEMTPYKPPVDPSYFLPLVILLLGFGISHLAFFFVYLTTVKKSRSFFKELRLALVSSTTLSLGTLFLFLYFGVWL